MSAAALRQEPQLQARPSYCSTEEAILVRGFNLDLAQVYLSLHGSFPEPGARVRFVLMSDIGSRSPGIPALTTGRWPVGAALALDLNGHRIAGAGGNGG